MILVHLHNHPHLLLLKFKSEAKGAATPFQLCVPPPLSAVAQAHGLRLAAVGRPGGLLETGEAETEGLQVGHSFASC